MRISARGAVCAAAVGAALFFLACSGASEGEEALRAATATKAPSRTPAPLATATLEPTPEATPIPSPEPSPVPPVDTPATQPTPALDPAGVPVIELLPPDIGQGECATIRLWGRGAASASATFAGRLYPLVADGGYFWGVLATGAFQEPGVYPVTVQLFHASGGLFETLETQINVVDIQYAVENIDLPPESSSLLTPELAQQEEAIRANVFALFTPQKLWSGPFIYPVQAVIVSPYGIGRSYNGGPVTGYHHGVDLAGNEGDWVAASNSGRVAYAGPSPIRGDTVIIDHGVGVFSCYSHLSAMNVQAGQMVNKGDLIGAVGSTGMVTGPHLHWEIVVRGVEMDPIPWTLQTIGP
ncbi:MAG: M23 family metallopeptidase [Dehalococcoidia bacterium]|nr:M23 family metallopeptidase [Dehalococcoidia bacterium]